MIRWITRTVDDPTLDLRYVYLQCFGNFRVGEILPYVFEA